MTALSEVQPSKGHTDENFPVASRIVAPRHRATILAFYRFARAADDVADHPRMLPEHKLRRLDDLENTLLGAADSAADALPLRAALHEKKLSSQHALDLLTAFRRDVTKNRYENWDDLMDYCRYSAMPVGRFVLDVHGESKSLWPANDALCAALQVITICRIVAKTIAISTGSMCLWTRSPQPASKSRPWRRPWHRRPCGARYAVLRIETQLYWSAAPIFPVGLRIFV
jgi:phytoene/squalene synthetase